MAEWLALAEVAARPLAGRGFSVHPQGGLDHAGFRVQAAGWRAAFAGQAGQRVAMYFEDAARREDAGTVHGCLAADLRRTGRNRGRFRR